MGRAPAAQAYPRPGSAIEYVALITGYDFLLVVVALLYLAAWLLATRFRFLADRDLSAGTSPSEAT